MFHSTGAPGASAVSRPLPTSLVLPISLEELREAAAALRCCTMLEVTSWEHHDQGKGRAKASAWLKSQTTDVSPLQGPFWCELPWDYQAVTVLKQNSLSHREAWTRAEELLVQLLALGGLSLDFFFFFPPVTALFQKMCHVGFTSTPESAGSLLWYQLNITDVIWQFQCQVAWDREQEARIQFSVCHGFPGYTLLCQCLIYVITAVPWLILHTNIPLCANPFCKWSVSSPVPPGLVSRVPIK